MGPGPAAPSLPPGSHSSHSSHNSTSSTSSRTHSPRSVHTRAPRSMHVCPTVCAHVCPTVRTHACPAALPSRQVAPTHCWGQRHSKPSTWSTQVPPAAHGLEAHSSMSVEGRGRACERRGGRPGAWVPWGGGPSARGFLSRSPGRKAHSHMGGRGSRSPSRVPPPHPSGAGYSPPAASRGLTQSAGGSTPAGWAAALEASGHLVAGAPVGTGVGGAGVLSCIGNRRRRWVVGVTAQGPTFPQGSPQTPRLQGGVQVCPRQKEAGALGLTGSGAPAGPGRAHLPRSQFLPE